jgi:hypothetical protein
MISPSRYIPTWVYEGLPRRLRFPRIVLEHVRNDTRLGLSVHRLDHHLSPSTALRLRKQLDAANQCCRPCPRFYVGPYLWPLVSAGYTALASVASMFEALYACVRRFVAAQPLPMPSFAPTAASPEPTAPPECPLHVMYESPRYHPYADTPMVPKTRKMVIEPNLFEPAYIQAKVFNGIRPGRLEMKRRGMCVVSAVTAAHHFARPPINYTSQASSVFLGLTSDLAGQVSASIHSLLFPSCNTQVISAIKTAWTFDWYNTFRSDLPSHEVENTYYLHSIVAVTTPQKLYIAAQGNCTAHLISGQTIRRLYGEGRLLAHETQQDLESCYSESPVPFDLPLKLEPTTKPIKHVPQILTFDSKDIGDGLVVLSSPGLFERLERPLGTAAASFFHQTMSDPKHGVDDSTYLGERFSSDSEDNCLTILQPYSTEHRS